MNNIIDELIGYDIEDLIFDILQEIILPEEKSTIDFLRDNNKYSRLYYIDISILLERTDGSDLIIPVRSFGKINKMAVKYLRNNMNSETLQFINPVLEKISNIFNFNDILQNIMSGKLSYEINELRYSSNEERLEIENRKINNILDNKQSTFINVETTRFIKFGKICSDEYYLKNGCMISCFLEVFYKRLNNTLKNCKDLEISNLYKLATGLDFCLNSEDYGITLKQATKWCDRFQIEMLAIDTNGKIIFQYSPKIVSKKIIGGHLWRILIHSGHVFNITENLKEFDRLHSRVSNYIKNLIDVKVNITIPSEKTKKWPKLQKYEERTYEHISSFNELSISNCQEFLTRNVEALFQECLTNKVEPSNLRLNNGIIISFEVLIYIQEKLKLCKIQSIDNFSSLSNQPYDINMIIDKYQQLKFDKYLHELREILTPNTAISTYSNSLYKCFKTYQRGPIVSRIEKFEKTGEFLEIDINRAYCSNMLEIDYIPVFSIFDEVFEYKEQKLDNNSFYLIQCFNCDTVLLNRKFDFVTGELLNYVNSIQINDKKFKYKIIGVCNPYKKIYIGDTLRNKIKEIYDDTTINKKTKKNLVNILYGICNKSRNKKQLGRVFLDENEAKDNGNYINVKYSNDKNAYIVINQTKQDLNGGFLVLGRIILDKQRIKIHKMITKLKNNGIETYAVRTDAIYVPYQHIEIVKNNLNIHNGEVDYKNIGTLRLTKCSNPNLQYKIFYDDHPDIAFLEIEPITYLAQDFKELKNENKMTNKNISLDERFEEFNDLFNTNMTILKAKVGGGGKTFSVINYYTMNKKKLLIVSPYNMLCDDIKKKGLKSITLYKLLGKTLECFEKKNQSVKYNIEGFDAIHFEEIFLYNINELTWIKKFINENNHIKFSAAGDEFQLKPVQSNDISESYHNFIIHSMFNNCILLKTSKRVSDINEQKKMLDISDELKKDIDGKLSIEKLKSLGIKCRALKDAKKESKFLTSKHVSFLKATTDELNEFIHKTKTIGTMKYFVEQKLLGTGKGGTKTNREYKINSIKFNKIFEVENYNGKIKTYTLDKMDSFKYNYANTCHAYQGMSLGDSIYIHNYNFNRVDNRWLYVAITRCSSLDITIVI